ncbi:negative regulation of transposition, RNA-mediated [Homalodisca vitripennis]|nr:negative regulation of transposition, RNA-mediated [Homalodisca vitripennis]
MFLPFQSLEKWNMREMSRVQNVSYRKISQRKNLVMVGSRSSGKTTGYVIPIASNLLDSSFYKELPVGCGPRALIITPSWKAGLEVTTMFRDLTKYIRVIHTYGGGAELEMRLELLNGSDVLVSTPRCLLRLLEARATDLKRLCHLVMDDAHILFEKFKPEIEQLMVSVDRMEDKRLKQGLKIDLQVVVASSRWTVPIKELSVNILANPTIVIASQLEACVYADVKPVAYFVRSSRKAEKLVELLNGIKGQLRTVVACKKKDDVKFVYNLLTDLGMENVLAAHEDLTSVNISEIPQMWKHKEKDVITAWQNSQGASLPILIRSDELRELPITNAHVLIHYNMPISLKGFSLRFICLIDNFRNILRQEENVHKKKCQVHILMDEDNYQEMPGVMEFMKRLGTVLPTPVEQTLEKLEQKREEEKLKESLCEDLKEFGCCWDSKKCPNRHVLSRNQDLPQDIPKSGMVKILIQHVHDACHFSARLLEHSEKKGQWQKLPSKMLELCLEINIYYKEKKNRKLHGLPSVGDLVCVESSHDTYHRAVVLKITKVNKHGEPEAVNIRLIDNGSYFEDFSVMYLYQLPASLRSPPPQVVDVYLCSMMPKDLDTCWSPAIKAWVETHLRDARRHSPKGYLAGKIVLSLGKNVWLEPMSFMEHLPQLNTTVFKFSLRRDLLNTNNALENPDHLPNLYKLCEKAGIEIPKEEPEQTKPQNLVQAKPRWAWLPMDNSEAVHVVTVQEPNVIFVRLSYNSDCLERLMKEIQEFVKEQKKLNDVKQLDIGGVCLGKAPDADEWNRAVIRSKTSDDQVELFFVDYGDIATLTWNDVVPISDDLIKKLPFQVIECYLADVHFGESDDNSWEDDVIDQIYNLTRNENEEAINLHVQVCGVETVGTLSNGKRYKVILTDTNKEDAVVINKKLHSPNIINCTGEDEKNVKTATENESGSKSSSTEQQKSETPCLEITTMIHNESGSHVLLPDQFNIDENVAVDEKERRVLEFLNYFDNSQDFEYVKYEVK